MSAVIKNSSGSLHSLVPHFLFFTEEAIYVYKPRISLLLLWTREDCRRIIESARGMCLLLYIRAAKVQVLDSVLLMDCLLLTSLASLKPGIRARWFPKAPYSCWKATVPPGIPVSGSALVPVHGPALWREMPGQRSKALLWETSLLPVLCPSCPRWCT